jgi:hypothetical protein
VKRGSQELGRSCWFLKEPEEAEEQAMGAGLKETAKGKPGSGKAGDLNLAETAEEGEDR